MSVSAEYDKESTAILFEGNCLDLMKTIPDEDVQLIVTSPPYNLGKEYENTTSLDNYLDNQSKIIQELHRVCSNSGSICWQVGNYIDKGEVVPLDLVFYSLFKNLGMKLRNRIIWRFDHGLHLKNRFSGRYEVILWFTKSEDYVFNLDPVRIPSKYPGKRHYKGVNKGKPSGNPLGKNPSDIWDILVSDWESGVWDIPHVKASHCEKTDHPCQFPIELVERCVLALTNEGDRVYDPFGGVATTLIAARKNNRIGLMSEMSPNYCVTARNRIQDFESGQLRIRPLGKPIQTFSGKLTTRPTEWSIDRTDTDYREGDQP